MFAVVEQDVKGDGFCHDIIDLRLDETVEISRWMLVIQVVSYLVLLPDHIKRVKLYRRVYSSAEKEEFGVWILKRGDGRRVMSFHDFRFHTNRSHTLTSEGQMGHVRNSIPFTIVNSKMRKVTVAGKLKNISGVKLRMRVMLREKKVKISWNYILNT